ncbi:MAG: CCA tRNA nucleotidyltransferase [Alphaproteobacteria bacterium]|nr:CCA tRNA nucleotidyltransferase [Alphaproteobacteria bacterium]
MKPARQIEPTEWMRAAPTRAVIDALSADGQEIRFVGGCVRDTLLGHGHDGGGHSDIDIATPDRPQQVIALLDRAGIKNIPTGIEHGTVTAVAEGQHFEITTLRVDVKTHGRHADVAFTDDWREDAARRDFTMNALSCTPDGQIHDPWDGIADLEAGRVRFVGDAGRRIEEDHLRLLRFFRFHAWYGTGAPDSGGLAAATAAAKLLHKLSGERIRNEMLKLLAAPDPAPVIEIMAENGVLAEVVAGAASTEILRALLAIEAEIGADPLRRLAALMRPSGNAAAAAKLADRWRLSNAEHERLAALLSPPGQIGADMKPRRLRRELYVHGAEQIIDWLVLAWSEQAGESKRFRSLIDAARQWRPIALPVKGADALALGIPAGPAVGEVLKAVEDWWIEEDFTPTRPDCLEKLRALASALD